MLTSSIVIDTAPAAQQSPIPGLILISLGLFYWMMVRFARRHEILIRVAFGLLLLWILALIAPKAAAWFKNRYDLAKAAVQGTPPAPPPPAPQTVPQMFTEPPRTARHRASEPSTDTQPIPIIYSPDNYKGGR
jgi:hypothetical protein